MCPAGFHCGQAQVTPKECPRGYYCVTGVRTPQACPIGTYINSTRVKRVEDCVPCRPGSYCDGTGLPAPRGPCDAGFFCLEGSYSSAPRDGLIGDICPRGGYVKRAG